MCAALDSFALSQLCVTKAVLYPREVEDLTSPAAAKFIRPPRSPPSTWTRGVLRGRPYWDPVLKRSPEKIREVFSAMHRAHLLTWRRKMHSRVGCFVVKIRDGMQRLVLDALRIGPALR